LSFQFIVNIINLNMAASALILMTLVNSNTTNMFDLNYLKMQKKDNYLLKKNVYVNNRYRNVGYNAPIFTRKSINYMYSNYNIKR